ncbi:TetR/AcrR family transcriptional regulator [Alkalihalobacillus trypoxylicola]|uniref:TetR family transcriptional regulator n=1 Tax=Alkalihalobacillus trypoxylicola TaxID=519424 RepID=A0A162EZW8_9BACI|nr:TetR/AcrR family transcriptional regulator [Alkalihalobacillus trypoxylicola]KYG34136.1 TetR family transcriptional regulator [Alkalihalobacillus trypoxylicola]
MDAKLDSKTNILAAAARLFHLQGYHATGLNQILKESGAPKGSLYYYFPNGKEQLATEAIEQMSERIYVEIKNSLNNFPTLKEGIQFYIEKLAQKFDKIDELESMPIGLLASETSLISEPLRNTCLRSYQKWEDLYYQKLIENHFDSKDASHISVMITCLIEGAITRSLVSHNGNPLREVRISLNKLIEEK